MFDQISAETIEKAYKIINRNQFSNYTFSAKKSNNLITASMKVIDKKESFLPNLEIENLARLTLVCDCDANFSEPCIHGTALMLYMFNKESIFANVAYPANNRVNELFDPYADLDELDEFEDFLDEFDYFDYDNEDEETLNSLIDDYKQNFFDLFMEEFLSHKEIKALAKKHQLTIKSGRLDEMQPELCTKLWQKVEKNTIFNPLPEKAKLLLTGLIFFNYHRTPNVTPKELEHLWTKVLGFSGSPDVTIKLLRDFHFITQEKNLYRAKILIDPSRLQPISYPLNQYQPSSDGKKIEATKEPILYDLITLAQYLDGLAINKIDLSIPHLTIVENEFGIWAVRPDAPTRENYYEIPIPPPLLTQHPTLNDYFKSPTYLSYLLFALEFMNIIRFTDAPYLSDEPLEILFDHHLWADFLNSSTEKQMKHIQDFKRSRRNSISPIYLTAETDYYFARKYIRETDFFVFWTEYQLIYSSAYLILQNLAKTSRNSQEWFSFSSFYDAVQAASKITEPLFLDKSWSTAPKNKPAQLDPIKLRNKKVIESFFYSIFYFHRFVNLYETKSGQLDAFQLTDHAHTFFQHSLFDIVPETNVTARKATTLAWIDNRKVQLTVGDNADSTLQFLDRFFSKGERLNEYELNNEQFAQSFSKGKSINAIIKQFAKQNLSFPKTLKAELKAQEKQFGHLHLYERLTIVQLTDPFALEELRTIPLFKKALIHEFSAHTVAIDPIYLEELLPLLQKKSHTPRLIKGVN